MVVKTEQCSYTEYRIYPGRGQKFVSKDGRISFFITAKADSLFHQRIKAVKLVWSQAWRRMNKKGKVETNSRRNKKKATKFQKAIVGMTLDDMKRKRQQKTDFRTAAADAKVKEAKTRVAKKSSAPKKSQQAPKAQVPKGKQAGGAKKDFKSKK